jgi:hypothetical protein
MTNSIRDSSTSTKLDSDEVPFEEKQLQLEGRRSKERQDAPVEQDDIDDTKELTPTAQYEGELEAGRYADDISSVTETLDLLTESNLREGETDDPFEAAEEGLAYIPPIDPPTVPEDRHKQNARTASGTGVSALDEAYNTDQHPHLMEEENEMSSRIREALRADSRTTHYANTVTIQTSGTIALLRGHVDDLEDSDNLLNVTMKVDGVEEVIDKLNVETLDNYPLDLA